jgi:hypothetical protein
MNDMVSPPQPPHCSQYKVTAMFLATPESLEYAKIGGNARQYAQD